MEELKSLEKKNKSFKKQIKKVEAEIKKRVEINPSFADSQYSFNRDDENQVTLFDDLIRKVAARKDDHFKLCASSLDLFTKATENFRQSTNSSPFKPKRIKLGNGTFRKSLSTSNSLNISDNLNSFRNESTFIGSRGDATFISGESNKAIKNDRSLFNQTFVASKVCSNMNETFISTKNRPSDDKENQVNVENLLDQRSSTGKCDRSLLNVEPTIIIPEKRSRQTGEDNDSFKIRLYEDEALNNVNVSIDNRKKTQKKATKTTIKTSAKTNSTKPKSKSTVKRTSSARSIKSTDDKLIKDSLLDPNILNEEFLLPTPSKYNLRRSVRLVKKNYCC